MKKFKQLLAVLLATLMVLSVLPMAVFAEEAKEITALDLGVYAGTNVQVVDDPAGTGEKVLYAGCGVDSRPNFELADPAGTGEKFDPVAGTVYTVKFDYYLESMTEGGSYDFQLYHGGKVAYDKKFPKKSISSVDSGFSKEYFGDGKWHSMAMTFTAQDLVNTIQTGTEIVKETVTETVPKTNEDGTPVYKLDESGNKIPVVDAEGNPVLDAEGNPTYEVETVEVEKEVEVEQPVYTDYPIPYVYLTWYAGKDYAADAYIKNLEIVEEAGLYGNDDIAIGNLVNTAGGLVKGSGMTSNYDTNGKFALNEDGTLTLTPITGLAKSGDVGTTHWYTCITPVTAKGKSNPYTLQPGKTYLVTIRYKVDSWHSNSSIGIGYATSTSTGSTQTYIAEKRVFKSVTDGWETMTATLTVPDERNLKITLAATGNDETQSYTSVTLGDVSVAYVDDGMTNAKLYTVDDNGQPRGIAAYVGTTITEKGENTDNAAMGESFLGWYSDARYVTAVETYPADVANIYARYPSTIIDFNHMAHPSTPLSYNGGSGVTAGYANGIYNLKLNNNVGAMIPAYDAASVDDIFYRFESGVRYDITYYYQAAHTVSEEYEEEVTTTVTKTNEDGTPVYKLDESGNKIPVVDAEGNAVLDAEGNPTYEVETEEVTETVTKTKSVTTNEGVGLNLRHTLASNAGVAGGRDTNHEHGAFAIPDSAVYNSSTDPSDFNTYTVSVVGDVTETMDGLCIRGNKVAQFRLDKIVVTAYTDEAFAEGGKDLAIILDYNDGVTENEELAVAYDGATVLPTPTREGYIFAGWYKNYDIAKHAITTDDIPVSVIHATAADYHATYVAQWVSTETERVEFNESAYASLTAGDKGGTFSLVTDETIDDESADNTYAQIDTVTGSKGANIYKISLFHDDGSRFLAMEGVTYQFTVRYKVIDCHDADTREIGVARSIIGGYGPVGIDDKGSMSTIIDAAVADDFATATATFTTKGIYTAKEDTREVGAEQAKAQLALRINRGNIYVDYVEVTAVSYTPAVLNHSNIENATVEVDYNAGTVTVTPVDGYKVKGDVTAQMTYNDYVITSQVDENGELVLDDGEEIAYCYPVFPEAVVLENVGDNTYSFSYDEYDYAKLSALTFNAEVVEICAEHTYTDDADGDCDVCGTTRDVTVVYPSQEIDYVISATKEATVDTVTVTFDYDETQLNLVGATCGIEGATVTVSGKTVTITFAAATAINGELLTISFTTISGAMIYKLDSFTYTATATVTETTTTTTTETVTNKVPVLDGDGEQVLDDNGEPLYEEQTEEVEKEVTTTVVNDVELATEVAVPEKYITNVAVTLPEKLEYIEGTDFDATGLAIDVTYNDGTAETVTDGYEIFGYDNNVVDEQIVTVEYKGILIFFNVNVIGKTVTSIEVATLPTKTLYAKGQIIAEDGLTVKVNYDNGASEVISEGFSIVEFDSSTAGVKTVTVEYADCTATFEVEVIADDQLYISLGSVNVRPGDEFTVYASINGSVDVKTLGIENIVYDTEKLELTAVEWVLEGTTLADWNAEAGQGVATFEANTAVTGNFAKLTFKALEGIEDCDLTVACDVIVKTLNAEDVEEVVAIDVYNADIVVRSIVVGDTNDDGIVTGTDAVYLLYATLYPEDYPIDQDQDADYDEDGDVDSDDAIYLLYHVLFGEEMYPIGAYVPPVDNGPIVDGDHGFEEWVPLG